jgi:hypothetical protein
MIKARGLKSKRRDVRGLSVPEEAFLLLELLDPVDVEEAPLRRDIKWVVLL